MAVKGLSEGVRFYVLLGVWDENFATFPKRAPWSRSPAGPCKDACCSGRARSSTRTALRHQSVPRRNPERRSAAARPPGGARGRLDQDPTATESGCRAVEASIDSRARRGPEVQNWTAAIGAAAGASMTLSASPTSGYCCIPCGHVQLHQGSMESQSGPVYPAAFVSPPPVRALRVSLERSSLFSCFLFILGISFRADPSQSQPGGPP